MDIPTGYIVYGSSALGLLIGLFALAYGMVKSSNDMSRLVEHLRKEADVLKVHIKKPDLIQINRLVKISYKILKSPRYREENMEYLAEMVKQMLEIKKHMSDMDWLHAERKNMSALTALKNDSDERLKDIIQFYKRRA